MQQNQSKVKIVDRTDISNYKKKKKKKKKNNKKRTVNNKRSLKIPKGK